MIPRALLRPRIHRFLFLCRAQCTRQRWYVTQIRLFRRHSLVSSVHADLTAGSCCARLQLCPAAPPSLPIPIMSAPASSTSSLLGLPHLDQSMEQSMEQSMDQPMDKPQKKRRRPALACEQCRRRKVRCDRNIPCSHCIKSNITDCSYVPTHIPASKNKKSIANTDSGGETSSPHLAVTGNTRAPQNSEHIRTSLYETVGGSPSSTAGSSSKDPNVDWLVARVQQLEQRLEKVIISGPEAGCEKEEPPAPVKGTVSKTRYFGRSHWMCGTSRVRFHLILPRTIYSHGG